MLYPSRLAAMLLNSAKAEKGEVYLPEQLSPDHRLAKELIYDSFWISLGSLILDGVSKQGDQLGRVIATAYSEPNAFMNALISSSPGVQGVLKGNFDARISGGRGCLVAVFPSNHRYVVKAPFAFPEAPC